ncbi:aldehyde dehydrogenase family protein [Roseomonas sp. NAR14]|uniref:Aldehyde dehydrogenase n=1 Tax=Roseomonas acroporae TaxID=2937791 RepID=A0A9X2BTQ4_9PROT|nr:aldehyde dehydrogenase family protein [Roseomonas acroporae]MCK8784858.1 aldehyde dehydrogenase family protein [Roseomonas acroporae]
MLREAAARAPLDLAQRRELLDRLRRALVERAGALVAALDADYGGRAAEETLLAEVLLVADAARHARRHLRRWARPRRVPVPLPFRPARAALEWVPKGVVGVMAPWNYPVQLALVPLVDALAAGNRVALKPSESAPRTAALLAALLDEALGPGIAATVTGGPEVAAEFARQPWDHLVFTGGTGTGRKVMAAAAEHLTPLTLELGGKCPALVLPGADLGTAARAILAGKALNAGQTCVAPDTALLVGHTTAAFAAACRATGPVPVETALLGPAQAARLARLSAGATLLPLDAPGGRGGLVLAEAPPDHPLHREEVFGPLLPLVALPGLDAALRWIGARPAPLAIYLFGATPAEEAAVAAATRSGALVAERCVDHVAWPSLAFGGVGGSGFGRYHGQAGFEEFSNRRARVRHGGWSLARLLDPPRGAGARRLVRWLVAQAGRG